MIAFDHDDGGNGPLVVAFKIAAFQPVARVVDQTTRFAGAVRASQPANRGDAILLPGDPEAVARRQRLDAGVSPPAETWDELRTLTAELGELGLLIRRRDV